MTSFTISRIIIYPFKGAKTERNTKEILRVPFCLSVLVATLNLRHKNH